MAHMSQERKARIAATVKPILAKYGVKGSLSVHHHSTLNLTLTSGPVDFVADYAPRNRYPEDKGLSYDRDIQINPHWFNEQFAGKSLEFLTEVHAAMNAGNHNKSDTQTDYFDVGWYTYVKVGRWDKPYQVTAPIAAAA